MGEVRICSKRSRPWWGHPLKQSTWANGSSPTPAGQGRNQHRIKLDPLNGVTVAWLGQTEGPLAMAPGFIPPSCTGFLGTYSLLIYIFLSLDIVERALVLPQSKCALHSLRSGWGLGRRKRWREWELGLVCKMNKDSLFSFLKHKNKKYVTSCFIVPGLLRDCLVSQKTLWTVK